MNPNKTEPEQVKEPNELKIKKKKFGLKFNLFQTLISKLKKQQSDSSLSSDSDNESASTVKQSVSILSLYRKNKETPSPPCRAGMRSIKTISPNGYQAIITKTNVVQKGIGRDFSIKTDLDMKIRLPPNVPPNSVMVTMHMDPVTYISSTESLIEPDLKMSLSGRTLQLNCLKDTNSQTIFEGQVAFSSDTDIKSIGKLPLMVSDNNQSNLRSSNNDKCGKFARKKTIKEPNENLFEIGKLNFFFKEENWYKCKPSIGNILLKIYNESFTKFYPFEVNNVFIIFPFFNRLPKFNKSKKGEGFSSKSCIEISEVEEIYYRQVEDIVAVPQEVEIENIEWMNFVIFELVSLRDVGVQCDLISSDIISSKTFKLLMSIKCNQNDNISWNLDNISIEPHDVCESSRESERRLSHSYQISESVSQYFASLENRSKDSLITLKISDLDHLLSLKHKEMEQIIINSNDSENQKCQSDLEKDNLEIEDTKTDGKKDVYHNDYDTYFFKTYHNLKSRSLKKKYIKSFKFFRIMKEDSNPQIHNQLLEMGDMGTQACSLNVKKNKSFSRIINKKVKHFFRLHQKSAVILAINKDIFFRLKEMDQKKFPVSFLVAYDHQNNYHRSRPVTSPELRYRPQILRYRHLIQDDSRSYSPPQSRRENHRKYPNFADTEMEHRDSERLLAVFDLTGYEQDVIYDRTTPLLLNGGYSFEKQPERPSSSNNPNMQKTPSNFSPKSRGTQEVKKHVDQNEESDSTLVNDEDILVRSAKSNEKIHRKNKAAQKKKKPPYYERHIVEKTYMTHNFNSSQSLFDTATLKAERQSSTVSQSIGRRSTMLSVVTKDNPTKCSPTSVKNKHPTSDSKQRTTSKNKNQYYPSDDSDEEVDRKKKLSPKKRSVINLNSDDSIPDDDTYKVGQSQSTLDLDSKNSYGEIETSKVKHLRHRKSPTLVSPRENHHDSHRKQPNIQEDNDAELRRQRVKKYESYERKLDNEEYAKEYLATTRCQTSETESITDAESELNFQKNAAKFSQRRNAQYIGSDYSLLNEIEVQNHHINPTKFIPSWASMYKINQEEKAEREMYYKKKSDVGRNFIEAYFKEKETKSVSIESFKTSATRLERSSSEDSRASDRTSLRSGPNFDRYEFTNKKKYEKMRQQKEREEIRTRNEQLLDRCYNRVRLSEVRRKLRMKRAAMQQFQPQAPANVNQSPKGSRLSPESRSSRTRTRVMSSNNSPQRPRISHVEAEIKRRIRINYEGAMRPRSPKPVSPNDFRLRERSPPVMESSRKR